jgi:DNA-directed RNA polymerase specialized sigma subunit
MSSTETRSQFKENFSSQPFPWSNRSVDEWKHLVKPSEASSLFLHAQIASDQPTITPQVIQDWDLENAAQAFIDPDRDTFYNDLTSLNNTSFPKREEERGEKYSLGVYEIFSNSRLHSYLLTMRRIQALRIQRKEMDVARSFNSNELNLAQETALQMQLSFNEEEDLSKRYHELVELFMEEFSNNNYAIIGDRDDARANAYVELTNCVINFYWETIAINPDETANRFIRYTVASMHDRVNGPSWTERRQIQQPRHEDGSDIEYIGDSDTVGNALDNLATQEISGYVDDLNLSDLDKTILKLRILMNYSRSEIADTLNIDLSKVQYVLHNGRSKLRTALKELYPDIETWARNKTHSVWAELTSIEGHQSLKTLFQSKAYMLRDWEKRLFNIVLDITSAQSLDRDELLDELQTYYPDLQRESLRRNILKAVDVMNGNQNHETGDLRRQQYNSHRSQLQHLQSKPEHYESIFTERQRNIIRDYYSDNPMKAVDIAKLLDVHEATVSRELEKIRIIIEKECRK